MTFLFSSAVGISSVSLLRLSIEVCSRALTCAHVRSRALTCAHVRSTKIAKGNSK